MSFQTEADMLEPYLLNDFLLLEDYQTIAGPNLWGNGRQGTCLARIRHANQIVRLTKAMLFPQSLLRFKVLVELFKKGIILADNIFILFEAQQYYAYVIQAYTQIVPSEFTTLYDACNGNLFEDNRQLRKSYFNKIAMLLDYVHHSGIGYSHLTSKSIILDHEGEVYLQPFCLGKQLSNEPYERAYYSPRILDMISQNGKLQAIKISSAELMDWDRWAFGCITLQIFKYSTPVFMCSSLQAQRKKVSKFMEYADGCNEAISVVSILIDAKEQQAKTIEATGLEMVDGNVCLQICLQKLQNLFIKEELHITMEFKGHKAYHYYVDAPTKQNGEQVSLNKTLKIVTMKEQLENLLEHELNITLEEDIDKVGFNINLYALVCQFEGQKAWAKPIRGRYKGKYMGKGNKAATEVWLRLQAKVQHKTTNKIVDRLSESKLLQTGVSQSHLPSFVCLKSAKSRQRLGSDISGEQQKPLQHVLKGLDLLVFHWSLKEQDQKSCLIKRLRQAIRV